jgi:hypothetical protein
MLREAAVDRPLNHSPEARASIVVKLTISASSARRRAAWRAAHSGTGARSPGRPIRMLAVSDFSGLTSSAWALAKAAAIAATDSLERGMGGPLTTVTDLAIRRMETAAVEGAWGAPAESVSTQETQVIGSVRLTSPTMKFSEQGQRFGDSPLVSSRGPATTASCVLLPVCENIDCMIAFADGKQSLS